MSTVSNVTLLNPSSTTSTTANPNATLSQQDFLQLMVAQFQAADPLASDSGGGGSSSSGTSDYVNQLMSMTNLTTMQTMSAQQGLQLAQTLPGATVTITTPQHTTVSGLVTGTSLSSGTVNVTVNGETYPSSEITALTPPASAAANPASASPTN